MPRPKPAKKKRGLSCYGAFRCVDRKNMRDGICISSHEELIPYMTQNRHMTCVHAAAQLGCLDCIKWMVEHIGMHPNEVDTRYGASALHYAASAGHLKVIKFLLPRLVRVVPDYDGASPLHDAAVQGHLACVQELLKSPLIQPDLTDNYGLTAAEWAEQAQEKKCAKLLRECMKKCATMKRKKSLKREKNSGSATPAFSQYSDCSESHSSSPSSDTYAQLEPSDCSCATPTRSAHDLPPKLPDTPRPTIQKTQKMREETKSSPSRNARHNKRRPSNESLPSSREQSTDRKLSLDPITESLPPPPDSMLQSMMTASIHQSPPTPPPPEIQQAQAADQHCYYVHNLEFSSSSSNGKPMSAVPPFSHLPPPRQLQPPPPPPERVATNIVAIGSQSNTKGRVTSPITTPPAPMHSFSTFISENRCSSSQHNSPQHVSSGSSTSDYSFMSSAAPITNQQNHSPKHVMMRQGSYGSQYSSTSEMNSLAHAVSQISCHNPVSPPGDHMYYNNPTPAPDNIIHIPVHTESIQPTVHTESIQPTVPLWKQQLLEQKARKHSQEKQQLAEISETPDWKKLIQERKHASKEPQTSRQQSIEEESGLAPWQSELKRSGKVIPIELE